MSAAIPLSSSAASRESELSVVSESTLDEAHTTGPGLTEGLLEIAQVVARLTEQCRVAETERESVVARQAEWDRRQQIMNRQQESMAGRLRLQRERSRRLIRRLRRVLADQPSPDAIQVRKDKLQQLLVELESKREACADLQAKNETLAAEIAAQKLQDETRSEDVTPSLESMTWEQRKALIIQQLEEEDTYSPHRKSELIDVVAETQRVVDDRDREIAELRELLKRQPQQVGDNQLMGAAAFAEMLDADAVIQEERERLASLKASWEEKVRQTEIECSYERAKLARERRDLEGRQQPAPTIDSYPTAV